MPCGGSVGISQRSGGGGLTVKAGDGKAFGDSCASGGSPQGVNVSEY